MEKKLRYYRKKLYGYMGKKYGTMDKIMVLYRQLQSFDLRRQYNGRLQKITELWFAMKNYCNIATQSESMNIYISLELGFTIGKP